MSPHPIGAVPGVEEVSVGIDAYLAELERLAEAHPDAPVLDPLGNDAGFTASEHLEVFRQIMAAAPPDRRHTTFVSTDARPDGVLPGMPFIRDGKLVGG